MAQLDFQTLDLSTVVPVMFEGVAFVKIPSVATVFGGKVTLESVAEAFVTSPSDIVHEVVRNELNVDALKALYEQARKDDAEPPPPPSAPGKKPFPRRGRRDLDEKPHDRRWMMGEEVLRIAGVIVHEGSDRYFRCAKWELGEVTLWLPLPEALRQWLVRCDVREPQQRAVYGCVPKRDGFAALQNTCKKLREGAAHLKACIDALKQTVDPLMGGVAALAKGKSLLEVMDTYPEGDPRSKDQRLEIHEYRVKFEKLYEACAEGIARPNRYGILATFRKTEGEAADELIACLQSEQFRRDVEALCANQALAPPDLAVELWKSFDEAYGALVLSSRAGDVLEDLLEYMEGMSGGLLLPEDVRDALEKMSTDWLSDSASPRAARSLKSVKTALGALAKSADLVKKGGEALQGLAMGGGALAYMRWHPAKGGSLSGLRPPNELMLLFFRTLVRTNALKTEEIIKLGKAVDDLDWETYKKDKGFAGKLAGGRGFTTIKILFALAGIYLVWRATEEEKEVSPKDWAKIAKLITGILKDTVKLSDEAAAKFVGLVNEIIAESAGTSESVVEQVVADVQKATKSNLKYLGKLLEGLGAIITVCLAIQSLAEDWQDDFTDRKLSIVHVFGAIAAFAAIADLMVATAWLGPVAWILGLGATVAEVVVVANKSYATLYLQGILKDLEKTDLWHTLVESPRLGHDQCARNPAFQAPEPPYREEPFDAVEWAHRAVHKRRGCDCGEAKVSLSRNLAAAGFAEQEIQFMTGQKNFLWAATKEESEVAWGRWCQLVTVVK